MVPSCRIVFTLALVVLPSISSRAGDEGYIISGNQRTLEQVQTAYSQIPPVLYSPPVGRWERLPRTKGLLTEGGTLRVVMLGDSIVNDTSRSCWNLVVERRHPRCRIEKTTSVRGSTGCWWHKEPGRVQKFVLDHKPDLLIIGGISHRNDVDSIREVIRQVRESASPDILLMTGAFGSVDPRDEAFLNQDGVHSTPYNTALEGLANEVGAAFLDMETAWGRYVRGSGRERDSFKRDPIHANAQGEQILGHILANYLTPEQQVPAEALPHIWETCMTMATQWSYKPNDKYKSTRDLIHLLVNIVAKGGNFLLNVGPDADGELPPPALERMEQIGRWMQVNGEAIYGTRPVPPYKIGPVGLTCREDGTVLKDGLPYRGIGVNYFDAFSRTLKDHDDTSYEAGLQVLADNGIPFARFMCGGFWPADMKLYLEDRAKYFELLDGVVRSAERHGIGLIPSLFWHVATVPDLVGEPCDQWGNPVSRTHEFMRTYTREVVTRYQDSPAIWAWEFGNEYNLAADLPNAKEHLPKIVPSLGTPQTRSDRDILTHEMIRTAFHEFAKEVRRYDGTRLICTGNSIPRPSAWHQMHEGTWTKDSPEQFAEMLAGDNPDPSNTISVHIYGDAVERLSDVLHAAGRYGKPLFIGEFGVQGTGPDVAQRFRSLLGLIEERRVPLAALWVFDFERQTQWNVTADTDRDYQLQAVAEANRRIRQPASAQAGSYRDRRTSILKRDPKTREVPVIPAKDRQIRVIIDTDAKNEIDDIWALALAILSPERLKIEGFVAANFDNTRPEAGPDSIEASRREIETILEKAGMAGRYPVLCGSPPMRYQYEPSESEGVDFIIEKAMASTPEDPLWIVGLGASTDIASAYLKEPRIAERVIVFWHFRTRWPDKCWNFNVIGDVRAARIVFHSDLSFVLFDTGTHLYCPMSESQQFTACGELGKYLHQYRFESAGYQSPKKGFYDLGDIAALVDPDLASWEVVQCPDVDWDLTYKFNGTKGSILRCPDIDRDRTFELFHRKLRTLSR